MLKYFKLDAMVTVVGLALAYVLGMNSGMGMQFVMLASVLAILEVSLSFDNAVVNAATLKDMNDIWRHRFLTWGILIAVFGMRIIFPLLIVTISGGVSPYEAVHIAITNPKLYEEIMKSAHLGISGFGGAFLMMVALNFFIQEEKEVHWITLIEKPLQWFAKIEGFSILLTLIVLLTVSYFLPHAEAFKFMVSGVSGLITYLLVDSLGSLLESAHTGKAIKSGLAAFLYLEVLDASFSFDGVIGAFAITDNFFIMAIGLGIGAMFVRSLTIMMVDKGALDAYKYLEPAAFWSIAALTLFMFLGIHHEIPEVVTGLTSAGLIILGVLHSIIEKKIKV